MMQIEEDKEDFKMFGNRLKSGSSSIRLIRSIRVPPHITISKQLFSHFNVLTIMREVSIESNGSLEKTAVYINGEQIGGIHQMMIHISEDGDFETILVYEGTDKQMYTKNIFVDYLDNIEEDAQYLRLMLIASDGELANTVVYINEEEQMGLTDLIVQIQRGEQAQKSLTSFFKKQEPAERPTFRAEAQYRNEDDTLSTELIFG
jgi:hypothetical protein